jgi:hypothetical protein
MAGRIVTALSILFGIGSIVRAADSVPPVKPCPLPPKVAKQLADLAGKSDLLLLGETHGAQEMPELCTALLEPLTKLGYGALALEMPTEERKPIEDWALGRSAVVPRFFAKPDFSGRGNSQALAMIRTALSPPYSWRLICFDDRGVAPDDKVAARLVKSIQSGDQSALNASDVMAMEIRTETAMANSYLQQRAKLPVGIKVLAVCGGSHARTSQKLPAWMTSSESKIGTIPQLPWPSFAAAIEESRPDWKIFSVHVEPLGGAAFNTISGPHGFDTGVHKIYARRTIHEAEAYPLNDSSWDYQLDLPKATPATFLATPTTAAQEIAEHLKSDAHPAKAK